MPVAGLLQPFYAADGQCRDPTKNPSLAGAQLPFVRIYPIERRGSRPVYRTQAFPAGCISSSDPNDSQRRDIVSTDRVHGFVHTLSGGLRLFARRVACPSALTLGLSNKSPKMKITPARACSDGGEIVKFGLVRQPQSFIEKSINHSKIRHYGIRFIFIFQRNQRIPRRRDQWHPSPFHHVSTRSRNPARRFSLVRGRGWPGHRFSVARAAGFGKLHRNLPAASAPVRTGICRNTPVRHLQRDDFLKISTIKQRSSTVILNLFNRLDL